MTSRRQSGFGLVELMLISIMVIGIGVISYLWWTKHHDTSNLIVNKEIESECLEKIGDKNFCKFLAHDDSSYPRVSVSTSDDDDPNTIDVITIENDGRGNNKGTIKKGSSESSTIKLDGVLYVKDETSDQWRISSVPDLVEEPSHRKTANAFLALSYKNLGKEACGNVTCFKFGVINPLIDESKVTQYLWFDDKEFLIRKTEGPLSTKTVVDYRPVTITKPSPLIE